VNRNKFTETNEYPLLMEYTELMGAESILSMDEDTYKNVLNPRFWYAGEDSLWLWKCNALRSMINSGDSKYHTLIKQHCGNADERISEIAKWGCERLGI
jgi:epoxyqueuosine reductase